MNRNYTELPNGYMETIQRGIAAVRNFGRGISRGIGTRQEQLLRLKEELATADAIVVGAGAGLSTSAGLDHGGERFDTYFFDFAGEYGIRDMYSGSFYPFPDAETRWAWLARLIYFNRYIDAPKPVYQDLLKLLEGKNYFVITTNVDHLFQRSGFDKKRLFYTQGDYGLFQSVNPAITDTFDNEEWVYKAMEAQGFVRNEGGVFDLPEDGQLSMRIPTDLIPKCPVDGSDIVTNLRVDDSFLEDEGWHRASAAYSDFLRRHEGLHVLFLEIGIGSNTPVIIKYPFWQMTHGNPNAVYACVNYNEAYCPKQIADRSICIDGDAGGIFSSMTMAD
jgi:NAD-dependent SIR2 family protein deacetylase